MWSDHEEELFQQDRRHHRVVGISFAAFISVFVVAMLTPGRLALVPLIVAFAALVLAWVLSMRWFPDSNVALAFGRPLRERKAARRHRLARREAAIRDGSWRPRGRGSTNGGDEGT